MTHSDAQNEEKYAENFPEFIVKWTEAIAALKLGKPIEESWIAKGGFKVTSSCRVSIDLLRQELDEEMLIILYYIGFENLFSCAPSVGQISNRFFKGNFDKTIKKLNGLLLACAIQFLEAETT